MLFCIGTVHKTVLAVDPVTREIVQDSSSSRPPLLCWTNDLRAGVLFIMASDGGIVRVHGEKSASLVFSYKTAVKPQFSLEGEPVSIQHPVTGRFMAAGPDGRVQIDRGEIGGWETFQLTKLASVGTTLSRILGEVGVQGKLSDVVAVSLMKPCPELEDLAAAVVRLHPPGDLLQMVPQLNQLPTYPMLFAPLRENLARGGYGSVTPFHPQVMWGFGSDCVSAGAYTYGHPRILPYHGAKVTFGRYCSVAGEVTIILGNHMTDISSYQLYSNRGAWPSLMAAERTRDYVPRSVTIGNEVWIGYGATVLAGSNIGDGAIIGAGAVVRGTVPAYGIYIGNPGQVIRSRFDELTVQRLMVLKWWNWPEWKVDRYSSLILAGDMTKFLDTAEADND